MSTIQVGTLVMITGDELRAHTDRKTKELDKLGLLKAIMEQSVNQYVRRFGKADTGTLAMDINPETADFLEIGVNEIAGISIVRDRDCPKGYVFTHAKKPLA